LLHQIAEAASRLKDTRSERAEAGGQAAMRIHLYCRRRALSCDVYEAANSMWVRFVNTNNATPHHKSHSSDSAHVVVCAKHTHTARE
jgi:hypothetical protein